jgi:predicted nuclease with TOPRIM domain
MDWLNSIKEHERNALIASASKQVKQLRITFKNRIQEIKQQRIYKMQEKIKKREELERERIRKQTEYTNNIISHGLWRLKRLSTIFQLCHRSQFHWW